MGTHEMRREEKAKFSYTARTFLLFMLTHFHAFTRGDRSCTWWKIYMKKVVENKDFFALQLLWGAKKHIFTSASQQNAFEIIKS